MTFKQRFKKWDRLYHIPLSSIATTWMRLAYGWGKRDERNRECRCETGTILRSGSIFVPYCYMCGGKIKEAK